MVVEEVLRPFARNFDSGHDEIVVLSNFLQIVMGLGNGDRNWFANEFDFARNKPLRSIEAEAADFAIPLQLWFYDQQDRFFERGIFYPGKHGKMLAQQKEQREARAGERDDYCHDQHRLISF